MTADPPEAQQQSGGLHRRAVLRTAAAGALGALGGCIGTTKTEYEATPVSLSRGDAERHGFESEPERERVTARVERDTGVTNVDAEMTGHIRRYEYRGPAEGWAAPDPERPASPEETSTPDGTATPDTTPGHTPSPAEESSEATAEPSGEEPPTDETPSGDGSMNDGGRPGVAPPKRGRTTVTPVPSESTGSPETAAEDERSADGGADTLSIVSTPNPKIVGQSVNPAASRSIADLITSETESFERACDCEIDDPDRVTVRETGAPGAAPVGQGDVGRTIYQIDPESEETPDLPTTVALLGEERSVGYFAFASGGTRDGAMQANLVVVAKGTARVGEGTPEAVIAAYTRTRAVAVSGERSSMPVVASKSGEGLLSPDDLRTAAERFAPACPSLTGETTSRTTRTAAETPVGPTERLPLPGQRPAVRRLERKRARLRARRRRTKGEWVTGQFARTVSDESASPAVLTTLRERGYDEQPEENGSAALRTRLDELDRRLDELGQEIADTKNVYTPQTPRQRLKDKIHDAIGLDVPGTEKAPIGARTTEISVILEASEEFTMPDDVSACECTVDEAQVSVCVQCPEGGLFSLGHAFIRVVWWVVCTCGERTTRFRVQKSWGLYPNGIVGDTDEECEKVVARTDDADLEEVFEMVNFIQVRKHAIGVDAESPYGFLGNNCVDWAIAWYRQFDEERAAELDDIGQEPDTPGNLCEDITDRRKASDGD